MLVIARFFYRSVWALPGLLPIGFAVGYLVAERHRKAEAEEMNLEFAECILSVSTMMKAGYSAENAFAESEGDMAMLFGGRSIICRELALIRRGLLINISLEELLADLGRRSDSEDIERFAEVFSIAKRNGGNMPEMIRNTAELIARKAEMRREMDAMLSGKKMELLIMEGMPLAMISYIGITSPGYFDMLYHNVQGVCIMTGCLIVYMAAIGFGELIMKKLSDQLG
ncbi:MAG: type II secretion system F family protein [Acetatifactor sp.]|nr:type II secretion system F family protein [Acetatifactor sp.]